MAQKHFHTLISHRRTCVVRTRVTLLLMVAVMAAASSGCQTPRMNLFAKKCLAAESSPQHVMAFWKDAVLNRAGSVPMRGMGGRLYFYNERQQPVKVDGTLVVYAYDEGEADTRREPKRRYVFDSEQLDKLFSETDIGPSYSVWLPWDELGGNHAELSLIAVLTTSEGKVVVGEPARQLLEGPDGQWAAKSEVAHETIRPGQVTDGRAAAATFESPDVAGLTAQAASYHPRPEPQRPLHRTAKPALPIADATTIRLPGAVQERLARSQDLANTRLDRRRRVRGAVVHPHERAAEWNADAPTGRPALSEDDRK